MLYQTLDSKIILNPEINALQDLISTKNNEIEEKEWTREIHYSIVDAIKIFNDGQKYDAIHKHKITSFGDIFDVYAENYLCIQAEQKRSLYHKPGHNLIFSYYILYKNSVMKFTDFCKFGLKGFDYKGFENFFSTICYYIFEIMKNDESIFGFHLIDKNNPYTKYNINKILGYDVLEQNFTSKNSIKKILSEGISIFFDTDFFLASGKTVRQLLFHISKKTSTYSIINEFFFMIIALRRRDIKVETNVNPNYKISRHNSWCVYGGDSYCRLLNQQCHSSVGCAFYKETKYRG